MNPNQTWALVVGVEEYPELPDKWRLKGPASDAIRFVNWLLERGVPPAQIRLCLSVSDVRAATAPLKGQVEPLDTTRDTIISLLDRDVSAWDGELLFVFWGGHGSIDSRDKEEARRLYFSDAIPTSPASLSLPALQRMLNHRRKGSISRQVFLIDACATFQARANFKSDVAPSEPAIGNEQDPRVQQFQFFAARRGEAAANLNSEETGAFSREVLKALADPQWTGQWPPNMVAVARSVQETFAANQVAGKSFQMPIVSIVDWDGNTLSPPMTRALYRKERLLALWRILEDAPGDSDRLLSLFRATCPESPKQVTSLAEMFEELLARPAERAGGKGPPELELAVRARRVYNALDGLDDWIDAFPSLQRGDVTKLLAIEDPKTLRYVVIELAPPAAHNQVTQAWLYREGQATFDRCWTMEDLAGIDADVERICRVIRDTVDAGIESLVIEFLTPKKRLPQSPYAWPIDEGLGDMLGTVYPVSVRWRERLADPGSVRLGAWRAVAQRLGRELTTRSSTRLEWLPGTIADGIAFFRSLEDGQFGDLLMVGHLASDFAPRHPLMFALAGGATAACWWIEPPADEAGARAVLESMLATAAPVSIARVLYDGRRDRDAARRQLCSTTVLFWDHLDRNPYGKL